MPYTFRTQSITGDALQLGAAPYAINPLTSKPAFPDSPYLNPADPVDRHQAGDADRHGEEVGRAADSLAAAIATFVEANVLTFDKLDPTTGRLQSGPGERDAYVPLPTIIAIPATPAPPTGLAARRIPPRARSQPGRLAPHRRRRSPGAAWWSPPSTPPSTAPAPGARWTSPTLPRRLAARPASPATRTVFAPQQGDPATARPGLCTGCARARPHRLRPAATPTCWDGTGGNAYTSGLFFSRGEPLPVARHRPPGHPRPVDAGPRAQERERLGGHLRGSRRRAVRHRPKQDLLRRPVPRIDRGNRQPGGQPVRLPRRAERGWRDLDRHHDDVAVDFRPLYLAGLDGTRHHRGLGGEPALPHRHQVDPRPGRSGQLRSPPRPSRRCPTCSPTRPAQTLQAPKALLGQAALCDTTVPNPTNELLYGLIGLAPVDPVGAIDPAAKGLLQWFMMGRGNLSRPAPSATDSCSTGPAPHRRRLPSMNVVSFLLTGPVSSTPVVVP